MAVIHHRDDATSLTNAVVAANAGCHGVFLIQMEGQDDLIDSSAIQIKSMFPELLIGTNRLVTHPLEAIQRDISMHLDATWCDDPGIRSTGVNQLGERIAKSVAGVRAVRPNYLYFGSVAFKGQEIDHNPARAAVLAAELGYVATTSGPRTGEPPAIEKLAAMKQALGAQPLAVASGVSPANIGEIAPYVDWVLVSTGISRTFHDFDPLLLRDLVREAVK